MTGLLPTLDEVIRGHVARALTLCGGNKVATAETLGVSRRALYRLLRKYGVGVIGPRRKRPAA